MVEKSDDRTSSGDQTRLDATGEFFSVGAPLHAVRAGYIARTADDVLYETAAAGRFAHVIAPDRSGKSSLIAATTARLEANGYRIAILDLAQIGARDAGADAGRWYYSIAYRLLRQLRIRIDLQSWWQDKAMLSNRQRLVEFYSEVMLQHVSERIVVFVDEIQCIADLPFADQLLASIRAAHNARATDPDFSRLAFVLLGECDPLSLVSVPELSPFNVTQAIELDDFTRDDIVMFATELNLTPADARTALDRIYYWTGGQPYLTQKLARAVAREQLESDIEENVDRIARQQLAGRAALHNEPHLSHIHRAIVGDNKLREPLLNLYGSIRKGIEVAADLGSPLQRRLIAVGLVTIDENAELKVRNRIYERVFTARWANENLPIRWREPAVAAALVLVFLALPFWYTQLLPRPYIDILTSPAASLSAAQDAFNNLRSFPGHADTAGSLYRNFLETRAASAADEAAIEAIAEKAASLPEAGRLADGLRADFWDRRVRDATREERRDDALIASLEALILSTPQRRNQAAALVGQDYPLLLASLRSEARADLHFNSRAMLLTELRGARVVQWSLSGQVLARRDDWTMTALEVAAVVRRVAVDAQGPVRRIGLTMKLNHARTADLRIRLIAPSGRAVEIEAGVDSASSGDALQIPARQLAELLNEPQAGTWSLSLRDEVMGVAGQLLGWNLQLNSQVFAEDFERGLDIADPVETAAETVWVSPDGAFAVARATQSDNARIWDLAFAKPIRAIAVGESERIIGLSSGARQLVTATRDSAKIWDTVTGDLAATLPIGAGASSLWLTGDGRHLFVERYGDVQTRLELWLLETAALDAVLEIAGSPALVALDRSATRIAVADYDRAVRVWDFHAGELNSQIDLDAQPTELHLAPAGDVVGAVFAGTGAGATLWQIDAPQQPLISNAGAGNWQMKFSPSGTKVLVGRARSGFRVHGTDDGRALGPPLGGGGDETRRNLLGFSADEQTIVTGGSGSAARFWRAPPQVSAKDAAASEFLRRLWPPSGQVVAAVTPDAAAIVIGYRSGDVHVIPTATEPDALRSLASDVSFFGHSREITRLAISPDSALIASAARDNTVRVWHTSDGLPEPFFGVVPGGPIEMLRFSADASRIAIGNGNFVHIMDATTGALDVSFDLGEPHRGIAFSDADHLYAGGESGTLRVIEREATGNFTLRSLWQGQTPIRRLEASPGRRFLLLVDADNVAREFDLEQGRIGGSTLRLPSTVEEVAFSPNGSRVFFRTSGWVHRASISAAGLVWLDAMLAPRTAPGARMVFGDTAADAAASLGNRVLLAVAGDAFLELRELNFVDLAGPGLFGSREELLSEWRARLAAP